MVAVSVKRQPFLLAPVIGRDRSGAEPGEPSAAFDAVTYVHSGRLYVLVGRGASRLSNFGRAVPHDQFGGKLDPWALDLFTLREP